MHLTAQTEEEALQIASGKSSLGSGFPVYVIPWGMGNIPCQEFLCRQESDVARVWPMCKHLPLRELTLSTVIDTPTRSSAAASGQNFLGV